MQRIRDTSTATSTGRDRDNEDNRGWRENLIRNSQEEQRDRRGATIQQRRNTPPHPDQPASGSS